MATYSYKYLTKNGLRAYNEEAQPDSNLAFWLEGALNALGREGWEVLYFNIDEYETSVQVLLMRDEED